MEDYVLSVKAVFEGAVKDVPEDMLSKYYISDWYVRDETSVLSFWCGLIRTNNSISMRRTQTVILIGLQYTI